LLLLFLLEYTFHRSIDYCLQHYTRDRDCSGKPAAEGRGMRRREDLKRKARAKGIAIILSESEFTELENFQNVARTRI
jgi:hypothetical protein